MMQHHYPAALNGVEDTRRPVRATEAQFKETIAHCSGVRHAEVRPVLLHSLRVPNETRDEAWLQFQQCCFQARIDERDYPTHERYIAYPL